MYMVLICSPTPPQLVCDWLLLGLAGGVNYRTCAKVGKWDLELPELGYLRLNLTGQSMNGVEGFFDETVPKFGWSTSSSERSSDSRVFTDLDSIEVKKVASFSAPRDVRRVAYSQLHLTGKVGNVAVYRAHPYPQIVDRGPTR
jgi:hypothetical protein